MPNTDLEHLRNFAATARRTGFNVPLFRLDGNSGEFKRTSKQHPDPMNGHILASDPGDLITGWQRFKDNMPILQVGRAADGYQPAPREQLGDLPEAGDKDPWQRVAIFCRSGIRKAAKFCYSPRATKAVATRSLIWLMRTAT